MGNAEVIAMTRPDRVPAAIWTFYAHPAYEGAAHHLRVIQLLDEPVWHGPDAAAALGFPLETIDPEAASTHPGWETDTGEPVLWISTSYLRALAAPRPDFSSWMDWVLTSIARARIAAPRRSADMTSPREIVDARAASFSVTAAAQILSRDPVIQLGRETLADTLRDLDWIEKDVDGSNVPAASAIASGLLVRNDAWTPATRTAYNRVRITRAGLEELHHRLGGVALPHLDEPTPALIDA